MTKEAYELIEKEKMNFLEKLFGNTPNIHRTSELKSFFSKIKTEKETVIGTSMRKKILPFIILVFLLFMAIMFIVLIIENKIVPVVLLLSTLLSFFLYKTIESLFGKIYNYKIQLSSQSLCIDKHQWNWDQISETLIQEMNGNKNVSYNLVILTKSDEVFRFSLLLFSIPVADLCQLIESYKKGEVS